jgi:hypothetical protein
MPEAAGMQGVRERIFVGLLSQNMTVLSRKHTKPAGKDRSVPLDTIRVEV